MGQKDGNGETAQSCAERQRGSVSRQYPGPARPGPGRDGDRLDPGVRGEESGSERKREGHLWWCRDSSSGGETVLVERDSSSESSGGETALVGERQL